MQGVLVERHEAARHHVGDRLLASGGPDDVQLCHAPRVADADQHGRAVLGLESIVVAVFTDDVPGVVEFQFDAGSDRIARAETAAGPGAFVATDQAEGHEVIGAVALALPHPVVEQSETGLADVPERNVHPTVAIEVE